MKFGICNELFEGWELKDIFTTARDIGYQGVELAPFTLGESPSRISPERRREIASAAQQAGVDVVGLHWLLAKTEGLHLTTSDSAVRQTTSRRLTDLVHLCADLTGRVLILGSPQQRSLVPGVDLAQARRNAIEVLTPVAKAAEDRGVTFCLEPLGPEETNFLNTADEAWELAQEIGSPNVKVILDVKAMSTERAPVEDVIRRHVEHAGHVHANDPNRRGPGFGDVDFVPVMKALSESAYDGYVSVEVFDFKPDPVTIARQSLEYMQNCLKEARNG